MKKILLFGYYGHGNFGDDLILETLAEALSRSFQVSAVSFSDRHSQMTRELGQKGKLTLVPIKTERRRILSKLNVIYQALQIIRIGAKHDCIIFGGGTQIFETRRTGFLPLLEMAIFVSVLHAVFGKCVGHLFVGINSPRTKTGGSLLRLILRLSDFIVLRDRRSLEVCRGTGVCEERLTLAADTAYLLGRRPRPESSSAPFVRIGISLFPYFELVEQNPHKDQEYLDLCKGAIRDICLATQATPKIVFLGCQCGSGLNDLAYARRIACEFIGYEIDYIDYEMDTNGHFLTLQKVDVVIGMRLHILIAALLSGVPRIFALPYQDKVREEALAMGIRLLGPERDSEAHCHGPLADIDARRAVNESVLRRIEAKLTHAT